MTMDAKYLNIIASNLTLNCQRYVAISSSDTFKLITSSGLRLGNIPRASYDSFRPLLMFSSAEISHLYHMTSQLRDKRSMKK